MSAQNPLTVDIVVQKCKKKNLNDIKNINLWGSEIDEVSILQQMPNIEVVSLSVNKISTLKHFS